MSRKCANDECGKEILSRDKRRKFCSSSCAAKVNNSLYPKRLKSEVKLRNCVVCGEEKAFSSNARTCSIDCSLAEKEKNNQEYLARWQVGEESGSTKSGRMRSIVRLFLLEQAKGHCQSPSCAVPGGWSKIHPVLGYVPLTIDHIDGDWANNYIDNLMVLCYSCHSLTETFMALNKGKARPGR